MGWVVSYYNMNDRQFTTHCFQVFLESICPPVNADQGIFFIIVLLQVSKKRSFIHAWKLMCCRAGIDCRPSHMRVNICAGWHVRSAQTIVKSAETSKTKDGKKNMFTLSEVSPVCLLNCVRRTTRSKFCLPLPSCKFRCVHSCFTSDRVYVFLYRSRTALHIRRWLLRKAPQVSFGSVEGFGCLMAGIE